MQSNFILQLVITCSSHYRYWLMMALSMWRPWAVWPVRLDHGRYYTNYSPHQNRVHVLHLSLSLPLLTSEMPLLLWMDCLHWWHDWLCPRKPSLVAPPFFPSPAAFGLSALEDACFLLTVFFFFAFDASADLEVGMFLAAGVLANSRSF